MKLWFVSLLLLCASFAGASSDPDILYLSWVHDPATTMTIRWHTDESQTESALRFRLADQTSWQSAEGASHPLLSFPILVHTVELSSLQPDSEYLFQIGSDSEMYRFRTLPATLSRSIRFADGGDAYLYLSLFRKMNGQIAKTDPDFVIIGGDIAYTKRGTSFFRGKKWELKRWLTFLREWKQTMVTTDGRLIPLLPVLGNHDVKISKTGTHDFFYQLFAFPEPGASYRTLDCGNYLSLFLLDTGHHRPIAGAQTQWLSDRLSQRASVPFKMASYHVAAYPSVYPFKGKTPARIRENWVPLFEKYGVQAAFEHHNHAYKRTHPLKGGHIDPTGVLYLGDGSWGVAPRKPFSPQELPFLAESRKIDAFWLITLRPHQALFEARDIDGKIIDYTASPAR
jgi:hypothetical protein